MNHIIKLAGLSFLLVLLAACGSSKFTSTPQTQEEALASGVIAKAISDVFAASAELDSSDVGPETSELNAQSVESLIVIRRRHMQRQHKLLNLNVDMTTNPPSATAEVAISITGVAQLWEVYPDLLAPHKLVGAKPIDLQGVRMLNADKIEGKWRVVGAENTALTQGANAAVITSWSVSPDVLEPGSDSNMVTAILNKNDTNDAFLVIARGSKLHSRGVLNDNGETPDITANDNDYTGYVSVSEKADAGKHLGFITALNYTKTTDLTMEGDAYKYPYTDTLLPVIVEIAGAFN